MRAFSHVLLALHLAVFLLATASGAFGARAPGHARIPRSAAAFSVVVSSGDPVAAASWSEPRVEHNARPRREGGERGDGPGHVVCALTPSALHIASALQSGLAEAPPSSPPSRSALLVVHGPRGPPQRA
jgi:hypothetical protein